MVMESGTATFGNPLFLPLTTSLSNHYASFDHTATMGL